MIVLYACGGIRSNIFIKDKTGRINRIDNYRPIALVSVVSKVVERILLDRIYHFLETWPNQFGFKRTLGTDTCICIAVNGW